MKLTPLASNMTELEIVPANDVTKDSTWILFSYSTPVAGSSPDRGNFKTAKWYSQTTTRHIKKYFRNEWNIDSDTVQEIDQETIDNMLEK